MSDYKLAIAIEWIDETVRLIIWDRVSDSLSWGIMDVLEADDLPRLITFASQEHLLGSDWSDHYVHYMNVRIGDLGLTKLQLLRAMLDPQPVARHIVLKNEGDIIHRRTLDRDHSLPVHIRHAGVIYELNQHPCGKYIDLTNMDFTYTPIVYWDLD